MNLLKLTILGVAVFATAQASAQSLKEVSEKADLYNRHFFSGTPSDYLDKKITTNPKGTREFRTVLPGVLYRGGGPGGKKPLTRETLVALCELGFSKAFYGYTDGYKDPGTITCTNKLTGQANSLRYISGGILDKALRAGVLSAVKESIETDKGPVFVHCWNGYHASGELAAISLRQFCGWDGDKASNYWLRHSGGFPLISRIKKFTPSASLQIDSNVQDELCRQQQ